MNRLKTIPINFLKCGVAGWCMEVVFTALGSILAHDWRMMGHTSLLMFPIYGFGALLEPIGAWVDRWIGEIDLSAPDRIIRHGLLYMVLIFVGEYASGAWLNARGICPWDYSGTRTSVDGLIRLDFAPLWFAAGLLFERISKKRGK